MNDVNIPNLKPISLWQSLLIFVGCGGVAATLFVFVHPWLTRNGWNSQDAMMINGAALFGFLLILSLLFYLNENRSLTWSEVKLRFRIRKISKKFWLLVAVGVLFVDLTYIGLQFTSGPIVELMPEWLKAGHRVDESADPSGNYLTLVLFSALILLNVVSEEFLWRGYLLPRQELQHGKNTWWIHGIQWTCFHWFKPWDLLAILPGALVYGWLCTKTQSMIPGLVLHLGLNGLGIFLMAIRVFS
jgi:membrane protease YdiL (CAAX protease family)